MGKTYTTLVEISEWNMHLEDRHRWVNNSKINPIYVGCSAVSCKNEDEISASIKVDDFLSSSMTPKFWRGVLLNGVSLRLFVIVSFAAKALIDSSKEVGLEVITEKIIYVNISPPECRKIYNIKIARSTENMAKLKYLGTAATIKIWSSGN
jgi:hypothetical protein